MKVSRRLIVFISLFVGMSVSELESFQGSDPLVNESPVQEKELHSSIITSEFIFDNVPFPSAHASTILEAGNILISAWFGGTREGADDVGIWISRQVEGEWTQPLEVADGLQPDGRKYPCWNPVLFKMLDGTVMLFYKVGPRVGSWLGMLRTSRDKGLTWSDAERLPEGIVGPTKNKPIQLEDGSIISPSSRGWRIYFERSIDEGRSWTVANPPSTFESTDAIQASILIHPGGRLQALGRTRSGRVFETWSEDEGRSWSEITLTMLPNPNSGIDAVTLDNGYQLIVYNHSSAGRRSPLNIALSYDGVTWEAALVLESGAGEYSYPAVIQTSDGFVHITYTWRRQRIKHVVIDPLKLISIPMYTGEWPADIR